MENSNLINEQLGLGIALTYGTIFKLLDEDCMKNLRLAIDEEIRTRDNNVYKAINLYFSDLTTCSQRWSFILTVLDFTNNYYGLWEKTADCEITADYVLEKLSPLVWEML